MDDGPCTRSPRDSCDTANIADAIYGILPSRGASSSASGPGKRSQDSKSVKRKGTADSDDYSHPSISLSRYNTRGYWITTQSSKRGRLHQQPSPQGEMHQSTCLNLSTDNSTESDLWILPDFDEWELDTESPQLQESPRRRDAEWAPLVQRAVNSNRERLRRRLEGDGWDFVGGKYGEDGKALKEVDSVSEESVDDEFDVVVLPVVHVSC